MSKVIVSGDANALVTVLWSPSGNLYIVANLTAEAMVTHDGWLEGELASDGTVVARLHAAASPAED